MLLYFGHACDGIASAAMSDLDLRLGEALSGLPEEPAEAGARIAPDGA